MSSRVGEALRSARERAGWSREALAFHSGLSCAAIAQIESGRRQEVRLSTLSALARALGVGVDYLVGGRAAVSPNLLRHRVLIYSSDEEYVAATAPFLVEGAQRSECALVVTTRRQIELLRAALGDDASPIEFRESSDWYRSPRSALDAYRAFVADRFESGAPWIRIIGEPLWAGRSDAEVATWTRYESMVNLSLASSPATIVCPYDTRSIRDEILVDARRTHPEVVEGGASGTSPTYRGAEDFLLNPS